MDKTNTKVDKELEDEIIRYVGYPQEVDEDVSTTMIRKAARHFAEWQKERDKVRIGAVQKVNHQHGYDEGRADMRDELLKDALECSIEEFEGGLFCDITSIEENEYLRKLGFNEGDHVKIIIVKEEQ